MQRKGVHGLSLRTGNDMKQRIHILGASGSGTTTIAESVCSMLDCAHFDSDNYFWENTKEPFTVERNRSECLQLMQTDLLNSDENSRFNLNSAIGG